MALKPFGGTAFIPLGGGPISLEALLTQIGLPIEVAHSSFGLLTVRAGASNAGRTYFGDLNLTNPVGTTAMGYIDAREAVGFPLFQLRMHTESIFFVGTVEDTLYLALVQV